MSETRVAQKPLNYMGGNRATKIKYLPSWPPRSYQIQMNVVQNASQSCSLTLHCSVFCPSQLQKASERSENTRMSEH